MSFLETIAQAVAFLQRHRRVSLRALRREFALDADTLADLCDELVNVQRITVLDGEVPVYAAKVSPLLAAPAPERASLAYTPKHLAEQLDPEKWHQIPEWFFATLTGAVHRFKATVKQYTGDGIISLIDDPEAVA